MQIKMALVYAKHHNLNKVKQRLNPQDLVFPSRFFF